MLKGNLTKGSLKIDPKYLQLKKYYLYNPFLKAAINKLLKTKYM